MKKGASFFKPLHLRKFFKLHCGAAMHNGCKNTNKEREVIRWCSYGTEAGKNTNEGSKNDGDFLKNT